MSPTELPKHLAEAATVDESLLARSALLIVATIQGSRNLEVHRINAGIMTHKFRVTVDNVDSFVVRFYPPSRSFVVDYEPDLVNRFKAHGIATPEVVADSRSGPPAPLHYMVYRMIAGSSLESRMPSLSEASLKKIATTLTTHISEMAALPVAGWGDFADGLHGKSNSWFEFMHDSLFEGLSVARAEKLLPPARLADIDTIVFNLKQFAPPSQPAVTWADVSPEHVILDENDRVTGIIDFEGSLAADLLLNYGFLFARYRGSKFAHYLFEASRLGLPEHLHVRVHLYAVLRALRILRHGTRPLPTGASRSPINAFLPGLDFSMRKTLEWIRVSC